MARDQFFVVLHEGRWKIKHNGQHSKPYHSQTAALKDAIDQHTRCTRRADFLRFSSSEKTCSFARSGPSARTPIRPRDSVGSP